MEYDLLLKDACVIDENGDVKENMNIYIKGNKIVKVSGLYLDFSAEVIDCSGFVVTPGFVNLHVHSPMNILRGMAEDVNIDDWFNKEILPYESRLTEEQVYWASMLSIVEMLDNGVTAFADHYFFAEAICKAVDDSGIRADVAPTLFGVAKDFERQLDKAVQLISERNGKSSRLRLRMGPHAPYTCPPETLKIMIAKARELRVGIHIHLSETQQQVEDSINMHGKTPFGILHEAGGFDVPVIIGHGLWICSGDDKYLSDSTYFAVCPKTYMKLGMGYGHIWEKYMELPLCIGTDGVASSNTLNPLEQVRLFALSGKFVGNNPEKYKLKDMWKLLMRGHEALDFNTGKIAEGKEADLLVWNLGMLNTAPKHNPLAAIIYGADSRNIIHSLIEGKFVKKDGKLLMDTDNIIKHAEMVRKELLETGKGQADIKY